MRKAVETVRLVGLALALAGLLNFWALPVYSQGKQRRVARSLNTPVAPRTFGSVSDVSKRSISSLQINSPQQDRQSPQNLLAPSVSKIAFASDRDGNYEIYSMDADGGGQTRLTENSTEDLAPAWSPDSKRIAFVSNRDGNSEIYVMNADGTAQTRLTNNTADDLAPTWSPDGTKIAFVSQRDGNNEIYLMNADGSGQLNLTNNQFDDVSPAFSPDGGLIAFSSNRANLKFQIYRMKADGTGPFQLTSVDANDVNPSWATANSITFQSDRDGNDEIFTVSANGGSTPQNISNNPAFDVEPARSADGSKVVFASARDDNFDVFIMNADGSLQTRLTSNPANDIQPAIQVTGTIPAGGGASTIQFSASDYSVAEDGRRAVITVTRTGNTAGAATVDYATSPGTATNRSDYISSLGKLRFAAGETSKTFNVIIINDVYIEPDETITLSLSNAVGASLGAQSAATLTILDNDSATPTPNNNPIDDATFFVTQQYYDFLSREPDAGGLAFWVARITSCNGDQACRERRRTEVSAAFFIEQEYQQTAFFVYRLWRAAYGVPPTYQQFIRDRSRVIDGPNLEQNKLDLLNDFVARDEFKQVYPDALTPTQFVNKLFDMATLTPFTAERQQMIADLTNGVRTRAQVLGFVIEIAAFKTREFNPAFVLSQYFGYLQRDPDPGGFAFWLDVINNRAVNNYLGMVQAFITSPEYRRRFGPS